MRRHLVIMVVAIALVLITSMPALAGGYIYCTYDGQTEGYSSYPFKHVHIWDSYSYTWPTAVYGSVLYGWPAWGTHYWDVTGGSLYAEYGRCVLKV